VVDMGDMAQCQRLQDNMDEVVDNRHVEITQVIFH